MEVKFCEKSCTEKAKKTKTLITNLDNDAYLDYT